VEAVVVVEEEVAEEDVDEEDVDEAVVDEEEDVVTSFSSREKEVTR